MHSSRPAVFFAVVCLATVLCPAPAAHAWQTNTTPAVELSEFQPATVPKIGLRAALYLPPETRKYEFHYMFVPLRAGPLSCPRILQQMQASFLDVVRIEQLSAAYPDVDVVIAVQQPSARVWQSGLVHGSSSMSLNFVAYSPAAAVLLQGTEQASMKGLRNNDDIRASFATLAADECARFLQRLKATPFITAALKPPPPKPVAPAAPAPAVLEIASSASVQVYVDDEFKGTTSSEGHLVVTLPPGQHKLRLTEPGKKEWIEPVVLLAGERHPLTAQLESAGPKPLSEQDVEEALTNGVPKPRVRKLIGDYGVSFALSNEIESRLRAAGADDELLLAIVKNKK